MKSYIPAAAILLAAAVPALFAQAPALNGEPYIHDPSTIAFSDGKYFTFGTGGGGLISDDGWTWHSGAAAPRRRSGSGRDQDRGPLLRGVCHGRRRDGRRARQQCLHHVDQDARPQLPGLQVQRRNSSSPRPTASRTAMPSIPLSCSIPPRAGCGSPTEPISASSASSSSIPKRENASPATSL